MRRIRCLRISISPTGCATHHLFPIAFREMYAPPRCSPRRVHSYHSGRTIPDRCVPVPDDGPFGEPGKAILHLLMPHLRRAALIYGELGLQRQLAVFTGHTEQYPYAFLIVDGERRVIFANSAAHRIASARDAVFIDAGRLTAVSRSVGGELSKTIATCFPVMTDAR